MLQPTRVPLVTQPTPLVQLIRLGELFGDAQVWMKRDDLTGMEVSGNKVRKLEYVVSDAVAAGCDTIVTEGVPDYVVLTWTTGAGSETRLKQYGCEQEHVKPPAE